MVQRQPDVRPPLVNLRADALERLQRERRVGFVLQISDAASDVVVAHETQERHDRAVGAGVRSRAGIERRRKPLELERLGTDREKRCHQRSQYTTQMDWTVFRPSCGGARLKSV